jgi:hypothetical protein
MATSTLGTNATTSIPLAIQFQSGTNPAADVAALLNAMFDDGAQWQSQGQSVVAGGAGRVRLAYPNDKCGFSNNGVLFIPNRGVLRVIPGDWVGVTNRGWPILLSNDDVLNGLWTHNP